MKKRRSALTQGHDTSIALALLKTSKFRNCEICALTKSDPWFRANLQVLMENHGGPQVVQKLLALPRINLGDLKLRRIEGCLRRHEPLKNWRDA